VTGVQTCALPISGLQQTDSANCESETAYRTDRVGNWVTAN
jgi:hypothetical protein